jgi:hypothetical protein
MINNNLGGMQTYGHLHNYGNNRIIILFSIIVSTEVLHTLIGIYVQYIISQMYVVISFRKMGNGAW